MILRSSLILAVAAIVAATAFAGAAAAEDGLPGSPGATPTVSSLEPAAKLVLPRAARAGTTASVVLRLDLQATAGLTSDRMICAVRLGMAPLAAATRVSGGDVVCVVRIPRSAAGRTVRGALRVALAHVAIERQFTFKVARR